MTNICSPILTWDFTESHCMLAFLKTSMLASGNWKNVAFNSSELKIYSQDPNDKTNGLISLLPKLLIEQSKASLHSFKGTLRWFVSNPSIPKLPSAGILRRKPLIVFVVWSFNFNWISNIALLMFSMSCAETEPNGVSRNDIPPMFLSFEYLESSSSKLSLICMPSWKGFTVGLCFSFSSTTTTTKIGFTSLLFFNCACNQLLLQYYNILLFYQ